MEHKGRKILYVDYRELGSREVLQPISGTIDVVIASLGPVRLLGNIGDAWVSPAVMKEMKKLGGIILRQKLERTAVVGVTGVNERVLQCICRGSWQRHGVEVSGGEGSLGLAGEVIGLRTELGEGS